MPCKSLFERLSYDLFSLHFAAKLGVWKVIESKTKNVRNFRKISYQVFFNNFGTVECAMICRITAQNSEFEAELRLKLQLIKDNRVSRDIMRIFVISDVRTSKLSKLLSVYFLVKCNIFWCLISLKSVDSLLSAWKY